MDVVTAFYFAHPFWVWLGVGAIFLVFELHTGSGWLLWPAGSAVIVALGSLWPGLVWPWQLLLFALATVATTIVGRRMMPRGPPKSPDINDQLERLVGRHGKAVAAFQSGQGRVFVDGKEWSAEIDDGAATLHSGTPVEVTAVVGGARLRVRPA